MSEQSLIRNFSIIAHIDHGKSTLADRFLEYTGAMNERNKQAQYLDRMELEQERGITIKAQAVNLRYKAKDGKTYELNLIDTPGHVDFSYEVSRSLAACEGALLVVDSSQGVQAQTLANVYLALDNNLELVPVLNKIDLPAADPERVKLEIEELIGLETDGAISVSAKEGVGVPDVLEALVAMIPPPGGERNAPLQALIFDSWYDSYLGVVVQVRVRQGVMKKGMTVKLMASGKKFEIYSLGQFAPEAVEVESLQAGDVGFMTAAIKNVADTQIGDTITGVEKPATTPLPGFREVKPMVFAGLYPTDSGDYDSLKLALEKLRLNDAAFQYEPETSTALGFGFRCGFLGLLHLEIIQERLEREYELELITTAPTVIYRITLIGGEVLELANPSEFPDPNDMQEVGEPFIRASVWVPSEYVGNVLKLCEERRGEQVDMKYTSGNTRMIIAYDLPLAEVVYDFYDRLKSVTRGYATFDYEFHEYRPADLVKVDILINGDKVDALSIITHRSQSFYRGRALCEKMRKIIPRQMFEVAIQAAIGNRVISRETVKAMRKNVTAKCYGGDITRKRKLLEKQKAGKKRMKQVGNVEIPQEAFLSILRTDEDKK